VVQAIRNPDKQDDKVLATPPGQRTRRLLITGVALSIGNLAVSFALGTLHANLAVAVAVIGAISITMSLLGLEHGNRLGTRTGDRGEVLGGLVLIATGQWSSGEDWNQLLVRALLYRLMGDLVTHVKRVAPSLTPSSPARECERGNPAHQTRKIHMEGP
jgi:hypothetical protein